MENTEKRVKLSPKELATLMDANRSTNTLREYLAAEQRKLEAVVALLLDHHGFPADAKVSLDEKTGELVHTVEAGE